MIVWEYNVNWWNHNGGSGRSQISLKEQITVAVTFIWARFRFLFLSDMFSYLIFRSVLSSAVLCSALHSFVFPVLISLFSVCLFCFCLFVFKLLIWHVKVIDNLVLLLNTENIFLYLFCLIYDHHLHITYIYLESSNSFTPAGLPTSTKEKKKYSEIHAASGALYCWVLVKKCTGCLLNSVKKYCTYHEL